MYTYVITTNRQQDIFKALSFKGKTNTFQFDFSPWADDNGTVTAAVVTVESGSGSVANESLSSNVKSFTVATADAGATLISLAVTAGNNVDKFYLYILSKDPTAFVEDYGLYQC